MDKLILIEQELSFLGLLDKAREIYSELGPGSALSYIKSSYHLLSRHSATETQQYQQADQSDFRQGDNRHSPEIFS